MRWPLDNFYITQGYKANPQVYGLFGHTGLDLGGNGIGTPIHAVVTGAVIAVGTDPNYVGGKYVVIREDMSDHWEFYCGHMNDTNVRYGQRVNEGDIIGTVGMTGQATGPHVHFQVRKYNGGALLDPSWVYNQYPHASQQPTNNSGDEMITDADQATKIYKMLRPNGAPSQDEINGTAGRRSFAEFVNSAQPEVAARDANLRQQQATIEQLQHTVSELQSIAAQDALKDADIAKQLDQSHTKIAELTRQLADSHKALNDVVTLPAKDAEQVKLKTSSTFIKLLAKLLAKKQS